MRILGLLLLVAVGLSACGEVIEGSGNVTKETRELTAFNTINTSGAYEVVLIKGDPAIEIETDDNLHEHIVTEVKDEVLHIHSNNKHLNAEEMRLLIYIDQLKGIDISGAVDLSSKEVIAAKEFKVDISGAGNVVLTLDVGAFNLDISGGAELILDGKATVADLDITGAGEVDAAALQTEETSIDITGAGEVNIAVEKKLNIDITGAGEVKYTGDPEVTKGVTGAGEVKKV